MEPEIPTGSVVVVDGRKKEWNPGDVITYRRGNMVVTHRIVEKSEEGYYTKGDAKAEEDAGNRSDIGARRTNHECSRAISRSSSKTASK